MSAEAFARRPDGGVAVHLPTWLRTTLADLCDQLEQLVRGEDPSSDPAVARLFPAAYPDDPLSELEYERRTVDELTKARLASVERTRATIHDDVLHDDDAIAWLSTLNDVRLVLGSRLDVTEDSSPGDYAGDRVATGTFEVYLLLGEVQALLLQAIDPGAVEPDLTDLADGTDPVDPDV
jgi:hypothetical protein